MWMPDGKNYRFLGLKCLILKWSHIIVEKPKLKIISFRIVNIDI